MDFQGFVNTFSSPCAVLSVKTGVKGHPSEILIVRANDFYKGKMGVARYRDNMPYSQLVPKDNKFENFCYRCAIEKQKLHYYIELRFLRCWLEVTLVPLEGGTDGLGYCAFFLETSQIHNPEKLADVTPENAASIIKTCATLRGADDFYSSINAVTRELQERSGAFCCCIIMLDRRNTKYEILSESFSDKTSSVKDFSQFLTYSVVESWESTIGGSNGLIINDEQDMQAVEKQNPDWVRSLRNAYVRNVLLYPLKQGKKSIGYLFITNFNNENMVQLKELVELTAFFLSSEIAGHILMEKLDFLGTTDLLTGVKNRNAMNVRVDSFLRGEEKISPPFGVVFADLNGLKQLNDKNGHEAGDKLIREGARVIKEVFHDSEIYRAGGDEFVIIEPACSKEEFEGKVAELKQKSSFGSSVCLAIGAHWDEDGEDLRRSMHIADEEMYKDKENFYKAHSEAERRKTVNASREPA